MNIKDLEKGEHLIKDGNICALTYIKDKDEKDDLSKGEFIVKDNKLYQATPITNIKDCIEKKKRMRPDYKKKLMLEFGGAIEYLSKNDYKIYFLDENKKEICIVKGFDGGQILGTSTVTRTKKGLNTSFRKTKKYIPAGNFVFYFKLSNTNTISSYRVYLIPIDMDPIDAYKNNKTNFYSSIHPHQHKRVGGALCSGIRMDVSNPPFDIDYIITIMDATINGQPGGRNGLFHYNPNSPITTFRDCYYGKVAYELKQEGLSDLEIIKQIRIKRGEIDG